jgi:hypothetical protein
VYQDHQDRRIGLRMPAVDGVLALNPALIRYRLL